MIVVAGKNNIAVAALNHLIFDLGVPVKEIAVVCNQTENGMDHWQMSLRKRARELKVKELTIEQAEKDASCFFSLEFDRIVRPERFRTDRVFNIHFSLLPKYKGMYTSIWPILNGDSQSGCTLHLIDPGIDTGDIIDQLAFELSEEDCSADLYLKYIKCSIELFLRNASYLLSQDCKATKQAKRESTYFSKQALDFRNIKINFNNTAWSIGRQVKAFSFRPYQLPAVDGRCVVNYKILDNKSKVRPGALIGETDEYVEYSTIDYDILLYKDRQSDVFNAIRNGDVFRIDSLLNCLPSLEDRTKESWSMLMVAAFYGRQDILEKLILLGADVNGINYKGTTVLMYAKDFALKSGDLSSFNLLLEYGANLFAKDLLHKDLNDYVRNNQAWNNLLTEQNRTEQNRTEQNRTEQNRTEQNSRK